MNRVIVSRGNPVRTMAGQFHLPEEVTLQWPKRCAIDLRRWRGFARPK
jgi:hypothetical protein